MRDLTIFETIVQPSVEKIALVDVQYPDVSDGRACIVSHVIHRNVFTGFDQKLSRHLAAIRGSGFPAISATIRIREPHATAPWKEGRALHFASVPHALRGIANRALAERETVDLFLASVETTSELGAPDGTTRTVTRDDVKALGAALEFCRAFGAYEFLQVSGDFDLLLVQPASSDLNPVSMDLYRGVISLPSAYGRSNDGFEGALFDFRRHASEHRAVRNYLANARHAVAAAKEDAVLTFRAAAEDRILSFDRALCGRVLEGHRLDAVMSLVARLRAGLGDDLAGISEDARITALDWAEAVNNGGTRSTGTSRGAGNGSAGPGSGPSAPGADAGGGGGATHHPRVRPLPNSGFRSASTG